MDIVTQKQLNMLVQLAKKDKRFHRSEREMIYQLAETKNFPKNEVDQLLKSTEPVESLGALSPNQKFEYLYNAVKLMKVDRDIAECEVTFCQDLAIKMGYRKEVVQMLIDEIDPTEESPNLKPVREKFDHYDAFKAYY